MSRAFVRESDMPQEPELPAPAAVLPPGAKNYVTPAGAERLRQELARLLESRPSLAAASAHDVDARRELQALDRRIRHLQESLRTAEVVAPDAGPADVVRFGATVTLREPDGAESRYRIVGVDEADSAKNEISWLSPLGRALLNARVGERVTFHAPRGARELAIEAIGYER
jgi:transcription elongation factor GreB